jgi:hypothetical protein
MGRMGRGRRRLGMFIIVLLCESWVDGGEGG